MPSWSTSRFSSDTLYATKDFAAEWYTTITDAFCSGWGRKPVASCSPMVWSRYVPGGTSAPELTCAGFGINLPVPSML
jgi:hypothetical protein